jgi:hypothetical protein
LATEWLSRVGKQVEKQQSLSLIENEYISPQIRSNQVVARPAYPLFPDRDIEDLEDPNRSNVFQVILY